MYHHLRGKLVETGPMLAVVEAGGIGYELRVPLSTLEAIKGSTEVVLYTHLVVREDDLRLYGFATREERRLFALILSVAGVGPTLALAALSADTPGELSAAIAREDAERIRRIKGFGRRLAERLVVELKDRVGAAAAAGVVEGDGQRGAAAVAPGRLVADAVSALVALGFTRKDAESRVKAAAPRLAETAEKPEGPEIGVESLIREALR